MTDDLSFPDKFWTTRAQWGFKWCYASWTWLAYLETRAVLLCENAMCMFMRTLLFRYRTLLFYQQYTGVRIFQINVQLYFMLPVLGQHEIAFVGWKAVSHCYIISSWLYLVRNDHDVNQLFLLLYAHVQCHQKKNIRKEETICSANTFYLIKLELYTADFVLRENTNETNLRRSQLLNSNWVLLKFQKKRWVIAEGNCNFGLNMPRKKLQSIIKGGKGKHLKVIT